jgi:hypothetical protein
LSQGPESPDGAIEKRGWSFGRVAALTAFFIMAGAWAWLLSPFNNPTHPDELDDRAFVDAADTRCNEYQDGIGEIPNANTATTPQERATLIDEGTELTVVLIADLRQLAPDSSTDDAKLLDQWLTDWDVYLADRSAYAEDLRGGANEPFPVTARDGEQISEYIEAFAVANLMNSCVVPLDV